MSDEPTPSAPSRIALSTCARMRASSAPVGGRSSSATSCMRTVVAPTNDAMLVEMPRATSAWSASSSVVQVMSYLMSPCCSSRSFFMRSFSGPSDHPSPNTSSVTPCRMSDCERPSAKSVSVAHDSMLMKPGATARPVASSSRAPRSVIVPMAAMRSASMATSPRTEGPPVPSYSIPPRMTMSCVFGTSADGRSPNCHVPRSTDSASVAIETWEDEGSDRATYRCGRRAAPLAPPRHRLSRHGVLRLPGAGARQRLPAVARRSARHRVPRDSLLYLGGHRRRRPHPDGQRIHDQPARALAPAPDRARGRGRDLRRRAHHGIRASLSSDAGSAELDDDKAVGLDAARLLPRALHVGGDLVRAPLLGSARAHREREPARGALVSRRADVRVRRTVPATPLRGLRLHQLVVAIELAGVEDPLRIQLLLYPLHHIQRRSMLGAHIARADRTSAVLAGHGAADLDGQLVETIGQLVRAADLVGVVGVDEDRRMDVPVAEVPVEDHRDAELGRDLARAPNGARDLGERHREVLAGKDAVLSGMGQR